MLVDGRENSKQKSEESKGNCVCRGAKYDDDDDDPYDKASAHEAANNTRKESPIPSCREDGN
jgi:hypothetical protein